MAPRPRATAGRRRRNRAVAVAAGAAVVVAAVVVIHQRSPVASAGDAAAAAAGDATGATSNPAPVVAVATAPPPSTTAPPTTAASTTTAPPPACDRRGALDAPLGAPPADWLMRLHAALGDPAWGATERSISVWVDGYGEVLAVDADRALLPASNEKVLTAIGARLLLAPETRLRTVVRRSGDHLVLVAGGDPTLRSRGAHSLAALARQVRDAGVTETAGVLVDATRFEAATTAQGWQDWQVPAHVGPMSALMVDDNRGRADAAYVTDPAVGNGAAFVDALRAAGVVVHGGAVEHGAASPDAPALASLDSATVAELSQVMLLTSDNEIAEALVRAIGDGSTAAGMARIRATVDPWCLHLEGTATDGSGLSREDRRSAREWRRLLQVAATQPWSSEVWAGLPVAGQTGTLSGRLAGPATIGKVRAKTGTIIGGSALSGYATTHDGRPVVFSIVVNGDPAAATRAAGAIDHLVAVIVAG